MGRIGSIYRLPRSTAKQLKGCNLEHDWRLFRWQETFFVSRSMCIGIDSFITYLDEVLPPKENPKSFQCCLLHMKIHHPSPKPIFLIKDRHLLKQETLSSISSYAPTFDIQITTNRFTCLSNNQGLAHCTIYLYQTMTTVANPKDRIIQSQLSFISSQIHPSNINRIILL